MIKKLEKLKKVTKIKQRAQKILGKSTKVVKSILSIILIIITFNTVFAGYTVKAKGFSELELYSKENLYCFKYRGYLYRSEFVVYNHEGKEYPAYCLNKELDGVSLERGGYKVQIENLIKDELVWKAIINGYPYKTYQELGCNNEMEAFTATKLAVYDMMYNYNFDNFVPVNEAGERVVTAIKNISYNARNSTQTKITPEIHIMPQNEQWEIDDNEKEYISRTFKISANSEISNYIIQTENKEIQGIKIVNAENQSQNVFKNSQEFKILIPIQQLNSKKQIKIMASANAKTYPVYYGKAPENLQNYAISGIEYETANTIIEENIPENITNLTIQKLDAQTKQPLQGFEFSITNVNTKDKKSFITNEDGIIQLSAITPGQYIIKEKNGPSEYILKEDEIKVEVEFNQKYSILVENDKKPVEQPIKLPKTGF